MSAGMPRPPGPSITWWMRDTTAGGVDAEISLTCDRHRRSLAGLARNAKTWSGGRSIVIVRSACGMASPRASAPQPRRIPTRCVPLIIGLCQLRREIVHRGFDAVLDALPDLGSGTERRRQHQARAHALRP